ncbi:IS66 family insertion sequence element accessory protein TnpB, partial [Escherichia coli]|nr:IS66 family insertion sequence element accessory protein TnpB [Escherichia coli]EJS1724117.1 IS66 family insertion sequence element accessory protein TnpB [Escherichia coli]
MYPLNKTVMIILVEAFALNNENVLNDNPVSGHLFIFLGRRGDTVKILWADADGLCLFT